MNEEKYGKFPKTMDEFLEYVKQIEDQPQDYNSIAKALTNATVAFFNYFASKHGMTGFQASWSGLQFLAKTRGIEAPFMIVDSSKMLYPQYDLIADVEKFLDDVKPELSKMAKERLEKDNDGFVSKNVLQRWKELATITD
jgi:hypothetical protein